MGVVPEVGVVLEVGEVREVRKVPEVGEVTKDTNIPREKQVKCVLRTTGLQMCEFSLKCMG